MAHTKKPTGAAKAASGCICILGATPPPFTSLARGRHCADGRNARARARARARGRARRGAGARRGGRAADRRRAAVWVGVRGGRRLAGAAGGPGRGRSPPTALAHNTVARARAHAMRRHARWRGGCGGRCRRVHPVAKGRLGRAVQHAAELQLVKRAAAALGAAVAEHLAQARKPRRRAWGFRAGLQRAGLLGRRSHSREPSGGLSRCCTGTRGGW
jgi:hypothetical protein